MKTLFVVAFLALLAVSCSWAVSALEAAEQVTVQIDPGWRYHEGYWNYYHPGDRAWYYTDGRGWYTYNNNAWTVYNFDRQFGRDAFYRRGYVAPRPGPGVVIPRHRVYVP